MPSSSYHVCCGCELGDMLRCLLTGPFLLCRYLLFACCVACGGVGETVFLACRRLWVTVSALAVHSPPIGSFKRKGARAAAVRPVGRSERRAASARGRGGCDRRRRRARGRRGIGGIPILKCVKHCP